MPAHTNKTSSDNTLDFGSNSYHDGINGEAANNSDNPTAPTSSEEVADVMSEGSTSGANSEGESDTASLSPKQKEFARTLANAAGSEDAEAAERASEGDDVNDAGDDPDAGEPFPPAPPMEGEFVAAIEDIDVSSHHARRGSRLFGEHKAALMITAAEPFAMKPLLVIRKEDGRLAVIDGRFRLEAIRAANPGNGRIEVRCVLFTGTEADAVAQTCDEVIGTVAMTQIEQARALYSLQQLCSVSEKEILIRYPHFRKISKINNMTRAARSWDQWPEFFDILAAPDRVSIDYGVKLFTLMNKLGINEQTALLDRARDIIANGERFKPSEAMKALQVDLYDDDGGDDDTISDEADQGDDPRGLEDVFGADDRPIGTAEQLPDHRLQLTLPPSEVIEAMSASEREENAAPFIARIRQHFGLQEG